MSEEEEYEGYDLKKVGALTIGIFAAAIVLTAVFDFVDLDIKIPNFAELKSEQKTEIQQEVQNQEQNPEIHENYRIYIDFGITEDDILDIQNLDCTVFETNQSSLLSPDPKYKQIIEQRRSEC